MSSNLGFARRVKSSQGSRRGTCGWITSFFSFSFRKNKTFWSQITSLSYGPVAQQKSASLARRRPRVQNDWLQRATRREIPDGSIFVHENGLRKIRTIVSRFSVGPFIVLQQKSTSQIHQLHHIHQLMSAPL